VLLRDERMRAYPSDVHQASTATRKAAVLDSLEREAPALAPAPFTIGHVAIGCALSYLDFRYDDEDWRKPHPHLARWHEGFVARASVRATEPVDDA
jgi:glutathione S-transferase